MCSVVENDDVVETSVVDGKGMTCFSTDVVLETKLLPWILLTRNVALFCFSAFGSKVRLAGFM